MRVHCRLGAKQLLRQLLKTGQHLNQCVTCGRSYTIHTAKIALNSAEGCCTATTMALTSSKQKVHSIVVLITVQFRQLSVVADYAYEDQSVVERRFRLLLSLSKFAAWSHLAPSWRLLRHETRSEQADVQEVGSMLKSRRSLFRTSL